MQIRPFAPSDVDAVVRLALDAWQPVFSSLEEVLDAEVYREFYPDWKVSQRNAVVAACAAGAHAWVADIDDRVAGFIVVRLLPDHLGEIHMIAVAPEFQRRGVGRGLTMFALDWMSSQGATVAMVETGGDPGHAPARKLYEACGLRLFPVSRYFHKIAAHDKAQTIPTPGSASSERPSAEFPTAEMTATNVVDILVATSPTEIDVWLDGGWGVDALLGRQTRPHRDLDVILASPEVKRFVDALGSLGFAVKAGGTSTNFVLVDSGRREIDVHVIEFDSAGAGRFPLPDGRSWRFPASAFRGVGSIAGRPVRCLSAEAQVQCHGQGYMPTEKDFHDMQQLQEQFEVVLPLHLCRP